MVGARQVSQRHLPLTFPASMHQSQTSNQACVLWFYLRSASLCFTVQSATAPPSMKLLPHHMYSTDAFFFLCHPDFPCALSRGREGRSPDSPTSLAASLLPLAPIHQLIQFGLFSCWIYVYSPLFRVIGTCFTLTLLHPLPSSMSHPNLVVCCPFIFPFIRTLILCRFVGRKRAPS
ncbi:hypothetical protein BS17DRAFT_597334 [Gyrodon lividus]|nr:hypothetical protein BS17DRAFT_597334 [Gyrodon lividus]